MKATNFDLCVYITMYIIYTRKSGHEKPKNLKEGNSMHKFCCLDVLTVWEREGIFCVCLCYRNRVRIVRLFRSILIIVFPIDRWAWFRKIFVSFGINRYSTFAIEKSLTINGQKNNFQQKKKTKIPGFRISPVSEAATTST